MMTDTIDRLNREFEAFPNTGAEAVPSAQEIELASKTLGVPIMGDYKLFLSQFGGGMVGPYPIFGLRPVAVMGEKRWSVVLVTQQFREKETPGVSEWVVFSEDHAGNPVGIDQNGIVWIHDHDFGGIAQLAPDFETYVRARCLKI